ncbi:hypothetical protein BUALT_Bualt16G0017800 [Buddleja alternifolia]|uniref:CCT domain-containing protein n=1 Tax=Buddleja alternifolia TaxID=168488 RepID=A0AAV6WHL4_9LAMI|nr:hypothetical protein BUALT_Bualt16G0017800 [Buddleja alternifolia]
MEKKRLVKGRKSRSKAKKPKFLSLRLQFPANESEEIKRSSEMRSAGGGGGGASKSKQLELFPLHPEINQVEDRDSNDHENDVAFFFSAADGGATSLTGLLDASASAAAASNSSHINNNNNNSRINDLSPSSASLTYAYGGEDREDRAALERNALRNRERDSSEEKWVCYTEVVERKVKKEEEVTSSAVDRTAQIRRLSLKLDYQEIMNAWSNKGPLYIDSSDTSQIVPDISDDFLSHEGSNNGMMNWGCNAGVWTVPEMAGEIENGEMSMRREEELKMEQREASVLRYKEKRQNRLFSRTIRYQVRKLNAEKRPRVKVRFRSFGEIFESRSIRIDDLSPSSASLTYAYGGEDNEDRAALERNTLRNRERDSSEEKWVCYTEVVEKKAKKEEEVTSSAVRAAQIRRLSLKLDYQEIMNAWSNKGPLYIDSSDTSQIIPDVNDDFLSHEGSNNGMMSWGCNAGVWTVSEMAGEIENGEMRMRREEELRIGQREASVLRYKEKRQNRFFSRTIRYQVRKLNAEKHPRVKGRFVKRS